MYILRLGLTRPDPALLVPMYLVGLATSVVALFMVWTPHPVYMVVSLVLVSLGLGALTIGSGAQFVGFVVVLVYVGAVNVLFLFVIMMINLRVQTAALVVEHSVYAAVGVAAGLVGLAGRPSGSGRPPGVPTGGNHLHELGLFLFGTPRLFGNLVVSLCLFVAMVSAICLTMVVSENYRTQSFYAQTERPSAVFGFDNPVRRPPGWAV